MSLNIDLKTAKRLYPESPEWFKSQLIEEFGEENLKQKDYEKLSSFDDCCKACGTTEEEFNEKFLYIGLSPDALGLERLGIINLAINGPGWKPVYSKNNKQQKWFPIFEEKASSSGLGFRRSHYYFGVSTGTYVGSRLCLKDQKRSDFSGTMFAKYWIAFITNNNL